jgi:hypothetical protein
LGVPEVWLWQDGSLKVYHVEHNYQAIAQSYFLPDLDLDILAKYINYHDQYDAVTEFLNEL